MADDCITVVVLAAGMYLLEEELVISSNMTLTANQAGPWGKAGGGKGGGGGEVVLDGQGTHRVMQVNGGHVQLVGLSVANGLSSSVRARPRPHSMAPMEAVSRN